MKVGIRKFKVFALKSDSTLMLKTSNTIFIVIWLLIACFPFIWTFWGSFKVRADFFSRADFCKVLYYCTVLLPF